MTQRPVLLVILLAVCLTGAFFALAYPMYVIRPFRGQGANELNTALAVRSWAPMISTTAGAFAIIATVLLWPSLRRRLARVPALAATAMTVDFSALTYVNVFEMMFHPIDSPDTVAASDANLENDDMMLAIRIEGQARAYPIRMMGYHHIVNDWVGGVPIVGTY
jgi:hypothetical protein